MERLNKIDVEGHWRSSAIAFRSDYRPWLEVFWDLVSEVSGVLRLLEGRRRLAENCSYLLLSKSLNHALAAFSLAERGLCVDSALASRNAIEALLLLQVLLLDPSEKLFERWSTGEEFKPGWVRNELKSKLTWKIRDLIVTFDQDAHDLNQLTYNWLSDITHANLNSANQAVQKVGDQSYEIFVGGSLNGARALLNAVFASVSGALLWTSVLCLGVFNRAHLEKTTSQWSLFEKRINGAAKQPLQS